MHGFKSHPAHMNTNDRVSITLTTDTDFKDNFFFKAELDGDRDTCVYSDAVSMYLPTEEFIEKVNEASGQVVTRLMNLKLNKEWLVLQASQGKKHLAIEV